MLRNYQVEMLDRVMEAWDSGKRRVLVQMPTGTGKTVLMAEVIRSEKRKVKSEEFQVLIVAHRRELIEQIKETLDRRTDKQNIRVESIQTLSRRIKTTDCTDFTDYSPKLVIIDEAHHAVAKTYRMLWEQWPEAKFLGLTATPCRLSGEGFEDLFDTMLQANDIQWFIDEGWLSDFEYVSARPDSLMMHGIGQLKKRGADGDYQTKEMATVMDVPESIAHLYKSYEAFAWGKKGIVYAIDRAHARHIAEYYTEHGVRACVIDAKTSADDRRQLVDAYRQQTIDVIVNVDIFSEGFDCPEVEFIQLARPTLSLCKYLQQVGRGMRVSAGKDCVLILDNVGLYQTFGLPTDARDWRLMFEGRMAGKGQAGEEKPVFIRDTDEHQTALVNLEMVRIKRRGEKHEGLEVYLLRGKYGVMRDGKVAMPAQFERVKKEGDVFICTRLQGKMVYWDAKGGRIYNTMPQFERIKRFEVAKAGQQLFMRKQLKGWEQPFNMESVFIGDHFTILGNALIIENDIRQTYRIRGYQAGFIYVESHDAPGYKYGEISRFGNFVGRRNYLPDDMSPNPDLRRLGLRRIK